MATKVVCKYFEEDLEFILQQEGSPKTSINEGYFGLVVDAMNNTKPRTEVLFETFCVTVTVSSFILTRLVNNSEQTLLNLTLPQTSKFAEWVNNTYGHVIDHYYR